MLFGIGMGGEWGVGASLALESASPRLRGLLSGLLQEGYAIGNLLAALAFRLIYPSFNALLSRQRLARHVLPRRPAGAAVALHPREGEGVGGLARAPDRLGDLPPLAASSTGRASCISSLLMTMMNFMSHGTQDMYPTLLQHSVGYAKTRHRRT